MNRKRSKFVYEQKPLLKWLFEQEEEPEAAAEDEPEEEEEELDLGDEGEPAGGVDVGGGGGAVGGGAAGGEEGAAEEEPGDAAPLDIEPEEEVKLSKSIDQDLEALFIDFEEQARTSQEIEQKSDETTITVEEGLSLRVLLEQDEVESYESEIDLDRFTAEVARLVKNYTSLLDMEKMLINKAREFILSRYGLEAEKELLNILADKHDIEVLGPPSAPETDLQVPTALGAGTGGAAGGGVGG